MMCRLIGTDACSGASLVGLREIVWPEALAALVFDGANCYVFVASVHDPTCTGTDLHACASHDHSLCRTTFPQ